MRCKPFVIVFVLGMAVSQPGLARAGDLATEVRAVFTAKCARCHGGNLSRPKGQFGHVLDLKRLAADADKVIPSKPDESALWQMIQNDEMPPPNSPSGPLSAAQKEVIRAWIAAGAPPEGASRSQASPPPTPPPQVSAGDSASAPAGWRTLLWLGKFHLLLLHFPIALLTVAALGELWSVWKNSRVPSPAVRFCVALAAVSAVPATALGWLYALGGAGAGSPGLLALHRWLGTITAAVTVAVAVCSELDTRRAVRSWIMRLLLFAAALLVGVTGHLGGLMVNGQDFYDW
jgi:hypothetical protein